MWSERSSFYGKDLINTSDAFIEQSAVFKNHVDKFVKKFVTDYSDVSSSMYDQLAGGVKADPISRAFEGGFVRRPSSVGLRLVDGLIFERGVGRWPTPQLYESWQHMCVEFGPEQTRINFPTPINFVEFLCLASSNPKTHDIFPRNATVFDMAELSELDYLVSIGGMMNMDCFIEETPPKGHALIALVPMTGAHFAALVNMVNRFTLVFGMTLVFNIGEAAKLLNVAWAVLGNHIYAVGLYHVFVNPEVEDSFRLLTRFMQPTKCSIELYRQFLPLHLPTFFGTLYRDVMSRFNTTYFIVSDFFYSDMLSTQDNERCLPAVTIPINGVLLDQEGFNGAVGFVLADVCKAEHIAIDKSVDSAFVQDLNYRNKDGGSKHWGKLGNYVINERHRAGVTGASWFKSGKPVPYLKLAEINVVIGLHARLPRGVGAVPEHLPTEFKILDMCSGDGYFVNYLQDLVDSPIHIMDSESRLSRIKGVHLAPPRFRAHNYRIHDSWQLTDVAGEYLDECRKLNVPKFDLVVADGVDSRVVAEYGSSYNASNPHSYFFWIQVIAAVNLLQLNGSLVIRVFLDNGTYKYDRWYNELERLFGSCSIYKPPSSDPIAQDRYLILKGFTGSTPNFPSIEIGHRLPTLEAENQKPMLCRLIQYYDAMASSFRLKYLTKHHLTKYMEWSAAVVYHDRCNGAGACNSCAKYHATKVVASSAFVLPRPSVASTSESITMEWNSEVSRKLKNIHGHMVNVLYGHTPEIGYIPQWVGRATPFPGVKDGDWIHLGAKILKPRADGAGAKGSMEEMVVGNILLDPIVVKPTEGVYYSVCKAIVKSKSCEFAHVQGMETLEKIFAQIPRVPIDESASCSSPFENIHFDDPRHVEGWDNTGWE